MNTIYQLTFQIRKSPKARGVNNPTKTSNTFTFPQVKANKPKNITISGSSQRVFNGVGYTLISIVIKRSIVMELGFNPFLQVENGSKQLNQFV